MNRAEIFGGSRSGLASVTGAQNGASASGQSGQSTRPFVEGEVIVQLAPDAPAGLARRFGAEVGMDAELFSIQLWRFNTDASVEQLTEALRRNPWIVYADPNYRLTVADFAPNDPSFGDQWALDNAADHDIDAPAAWDVRTDASNIIVAVIDTGIDYTHPDLDDNLWTNPGEIPGNGIDDDHNGIVDDVHGVNYTTPTPTGDPMDDNGHGTHVSGTIGAEGNNGIGVAGVAWSVQLMALKVFDASGNADVAKVIDALDYAVTNGARISNNSWGFTTSDTAFIDTLRSAIDQAGQMGHLFVAAAGNDASNNDTNPLYPGSYDLDNVIAVAATDPNDDLWVLRFFGIPLAGSNYGRTSVDLAAPGVDIYSTLPGGTYGYNTGTSMATPHVTGAAALVWAQDPSMTPYEVRNVLLSTVDELPSLKNKVATGGRLNLDHAINAVTVSVTALDDSATVPEDSFVNINVLANDSDAEGDPLSVSIASGPANGTVTVETDDTVTYTPAPDFFGTDSFTYRASDPGGQSDTATVTVSVEGVQDPPVAVDDAMQTNEGEPAVFDLLANDVDVDGDTLTIVSLTDPVNGTVALNADGTVTYTPDAGFVGEDSFTYEIADGNGGTDSALVTVTVDPEAIGEFGSISLDSNITTVQLDNTYVNPVVFLFAETFNGGDIIVPRITGVRATSFDVFLQEADYITDGVHVVETVNYLVVEAGVWTLPDGTTLEVGSVSTSRMQQPDLFQGYDPVSFAQPFSDTPVVLTQIQSYNDTNWVVPRVGNVTSSGLGVALANQESLTSGHGIEDVGYLAIERGTGSFDGIGFEASILSDVTDASKSAGLLPDIHFAAMQTTNGGDPAVVRERPQSDGTSQLFIQEEQSLDQELNHAGESVGIFGISGAPAGDLIETTVVASDDATTVAQGGLVTIPVLDNDFDKYGDPLTISTNLVVAPGDGAATVNPDGTITYTPNSGFAGADSFEYRVYNSLGYTDTAVVGVTVTDVQDPPVAADDSAKTTVNQAVVIDVLANDFDPDGDPLTVQVENVPSNGTVVVNQDNTITYEPGLDFTGTDSFTYAVSDGHGGTDTATVSVTVDPPGPQAIGEFGSISINHTISTVALQNVYQNPVVFLFIETRNGGDIVAPRIADIRSDAFDAFLQEPEYLTDGLHYYEDVNYLVVEQGEWTLPDGTLLEVGTVETERMQQPGLFQGYDAVAFDQPFVQAPVVVTQVQTNTNPVWVVPRSADVTASGFGIALAQEEANATQHGPETVGFLAIEPVTGSFDGISFQSFTMDGMKHKWSNAGVLPDFHFVSMQTTNGGDPAVVRADLQSDGTSQLLIQEDQSLDKEVNHAAETVGIFGFDAPAGELFGLA